MGLAGIDCTLRFRALVGLAALRPALRAFAFLFVEGAGEELFLFAAVDRSGTGGGAGRGRPCDGAERIAIEEFFAETVLQIVARPHVLGLFLDPVDRGAFLAGVERGAQALLGEGIKLLDPHDRDVAAAELLAPGDELVVDLAATKDDAAHLATGNGVVGQDAAEGALGEFLERRDGLGMAQQALGRHHDQRLAPLAQHLAAQDVEVLRRRGGVDDLDVVLGAQGEEPLQPGAGVLGALALEAVRQQQDEAAQPRPLVLGAGDELVDDHLGRVEEVAELRLPGHETLGVVEAVAVLEAEHAGFGERAVEDLDAGLVGGEVLQRRVGAAIFHVVEHGVAVAERAAGGVLAGEADAKALGRQGGEGQGLAGGPIERALAAGHLARRSMKLLELGMEVKAGGELGQFLQKRGETLARDARVDVLRRTSRARRDSLSRRRSARRRGRRRRRAGPWSARSRGKSRRAGESGRPLRG